MAKRNAIIFGAWRYRHSKTGPLTCYSSCAVDACTKVVSTPAAVHSRLTWFLQKASLWLR